MSELYQTFHIPTNVNLELSKATATFHSPNSVSLASTRDVPFTNPGNLLVLLDGETSNIVGGDFVVLSAATSKRWVCPRSNDPDKGAVTQIWYSFSAEYVKGKGVIAGGGIEGGGT